MVKGCLGAGSAVLVVGVLEIEAYENELDAFPLGFLDLELIADPL